MEKGLSISFLLVWVSVLILNNIGTVVTTEQQSHFDANGVVLGANASIRSELSWLLYHQAGPTDPLGP